MEFMSAAILKAKPEEGPLPWPGSATVPLQSPTMLVQCVVAKLHLTSNTSQAAALHLQGAVVPPAQQRSLRSHGTAVSEASGECDHCGRGQLDGHLALADWTSGWSTPKKRYYTANWETPTLVNWAYQALDVTKSIVWTLKCPDTTNGTVILTDQARGGAARVVCLGRQSDMAVPKRVASGSTVRLG